MVHARIHVRHVVNAAIAAVENPGFAAVRDLELLVRDAGLLVTIVGVPANESHVFVVDDRHADVELIDPVDNQLHVRTSHVAKLDSLADLDVEAVDLLSEKGPGKQRADSDGQENLFHALVLAEREARGNVETRDERTDNRDALPRLLPALPPFSRPLVPGFVVR